MIDLHGLHVAEAVALLEEKLPSLAEDGFTSIRILTGSGHHSKASNFKVTTSFLPSSKKRRRLLTLRRSSFQARLKPAVERFLASEGYQFAELADKKGHVGMLLVDLTW